jgi:hypothetical protein
MRTYFLLTTQAICLCLIATFFVTELTGITNGGVVGGWCSVQPKGCRYDEITRCPGTSKCNSERRSCIGFDSDPNKCQAITTQECTTFGCNETNSCSCTNAEGDKDTE